jgi:hypothetical protein
MAGMRSTRALCNQGYRICSLHFGPIAQELGVHGGRTLLRGCGELRPLSECQMWSLVGFDGQPWWALMVSPCITRIAKPAKRHKPHDNQRF